MAGMMAKKTRSMKMTRTQLGTTGRGRWGRSSPYGYDNDGGDDDGDDNDGGDDDGDDDDDDGGADDHEDGDEDDNIDDDDDDDDDDYPSNYLPFYLYLI